MYNGVYLKAAKSLFKRYENGKNQRALTYGCCFNISINTNKMKESYCPLVEKFEKYFMPKNNTDAYYFGEVNTHKYGVEEATNHRLLALLLLHEITLSEGSPRAKKSKRKKAIKA